MKKKAFGSPLVLVALASSFECGGRMIDGVRPGADGGLSTAGSSTSSSTTAASTTSTGDITTGSSTTSSVTIGSGSTSTVGTTVTTTTVGSGGASTTTTSGAGGTGNAGAGIGGSGGRGGSGPGLPVYCMSAPIPGSDQRIDCKKLSNELFWSCSCGRGGTATYCMSKMAFACGAGNCCGFDTQGAVGCAATPPTIPPLVGCVAPIQKGYLACSHVTQLNSSGYGPFTSCCPPDVPYSCPTGTPGSCFATAAAARANCKDWCVQCVPLAVPPM